jgi:hypothetical protein
MLVQADENQTKAATSPVPKPGIFHAMQKQDVFRVENEEKWGQKNHPLVLSFSL